ncbi:hypothetical protein G6O67_003807 [Ophiocordyceps sinensis]|uniref:Uncharacterized protein n=1 Tax=Ophiocordyceps sinensis TaxID=72228 RepID=A0A8H4V6P4_9HYPO|nr:hypothetical protein G6O67_003807 [Ophiocordyceps sinensis]
MQRQNRSTSPKLLLFSSAHILPPSPPSPPAQSLLATRPLPQSPPPCGTGRCCSSRKPGADEPSRRFRLRPSMVLPS